MATAAEGASGDRNENEDRAHIAAALSLQRTLPRPPPPPPTPSTSMGTLGLVAPLALVAATAFASAALYVSAVEHPSRSALTDDEALHQWKPSYRRAAKFQGVLALAAAGLGCFLFTSTGDRRWAAGAAAAVANWPFTLLAIRPTNVRLLAAGRGSSTTFMLLRRWGRLHAARVALGWAAVAAYALALSRTRVRRD